MERDFLFLSLFQSDRLEDFTGSVDETRLLFFFVIVVFGLVLKKGGHRV